MPPRQPSPNRNTRRRPGPMMPGGWMWLVLLVTVVIMLLTLNGESGMIKYSDFMDLVDKDNVSDVVIQGSDKVSGKVKNPDNLPEPVRKKLRGGNTFTTLIPQLGKDQNDLTKQLQKK